MNAHDILRRPLVSEKSMAGMRDGRYTFVVDLHANKVEIRKAVEEVFKVKVSAVNTIRVRGKQRRVGRSEGYRPDWKKAIVTLKAGQRIESMDQIV